MSKCYLYVYKLAMIIILVLYMGENFQTRFRFIYLKRRDYNNHACKTNWLMHVETIEWTFFICMGFMAGFFIFTKF